MTFRTRSLRAPDVAAGFQSGSHPLDDYFRRHALQNGSTGVSNCFVLARNEDDPADWPPNLGFYCLSMATVDTASVAGLLGSRAPRYPQLGVALIGRLAIHQAMQGKGLGEALLLDAIARAVRSPVACVGIVTDPKDGATAFYERYGFKRLVASSTRLFLSKADAEASFAAASSDEDLFP